MHVDEKYIGNLSGLAAIVMWSFSAVLISYSSGIPPFLMAGLVFGITFIIYVVMWCRQGEAFSSILRQSRAAYVVGLGGIVGYVSLYYIALKTAPIVEANLINYLWPLLIVLFSAMILKQKLSLAEMGGVVLGFCGASIIVSKGQSIGVEWSELYLFLPALGAAVVWGLYSTLTKVVPFKKSFMGVVYGIGMILMFCFHLLLEPRATIELGSLMAIILLGLTATSYSFWDYGMKKGDTILLASLSYLIPFFSTLLLVLFGRGDLSRNTLMGGGLIITGCLISNFVRLKTAIAKKRRGQV